MPGHDIIVIGASAGGLEAIRTVVRSLPRDLPASLFVVVHISPLGPSLLPDLLASVGPLKAVHPANGDPIEKGTIYVAPPDHHLLIETGHVHLSVGPKENRFRPAIDPLFRSAAIHYGTRVIGVVLTGNLSDGSAGLYDVKRCGGVTVVQDPRTAAYPSMPQHALQSVDVDHTLPVSEIAGLLSRVAGETSSGMGCAEPPPVLALESRIVDMKPVSLEEMNQFGNPSGFVCPECHGSLWRLTVDGPARLRCHVGHGYTAESLSLAQKEQEEDNLWRALQSMDERSAFLRAMAAEARADQRGDIAESWEADLAKLDGHARGLREILTDSEWSRKGGGS